MSSLDPSYIQKTSLQQAKQRRGILNESSLPIRNRYSVRAAHSVPHRSTVANRMVMSRSLTFGGTAYAVVPGSLRRMVSISSVSLSASGLPCGVPASCNFSGTASASKLTVTNSSTGATGAATATVAGSCSNLSNATTISLTGKSCKINMVTVGNWTNGMMI